MNPQADDAQDNDIVMPMYNLIEYTDIYSKSSGSFWKHCIDEPELYDNQNFNEFPSNNSNSILCSNLK